jgi:hypothetical protein
MGAGTARIGLGDEERLREIVVELAGTLGHQPIAGVRPVASVPQRGREHPAYLRSYRSALLADRRRLEQPRTRIPQIDGRIDLRLGDVARQVDDDIGGGETREAFRCPRLLRIGLPFSISGALKQEGYSEGTVGPVQTFFLRGQGASPPLFSDVTRGIGAFAHH